MTGLTRLRMVAIPPLLLALAACKPPAADDYVERVNLAQTQGVAGEPLPSPSVDGALWADSTKPARILYGIPGQVPLMALQCESGGEAGGGKNAPVGPQIRITRFAPADARAKALFAMIGNGHIARFPIDAMWNGQAWVWEGILPADNPHWDVLTGPRAVTATLPGAGELDLNPSPQPGLLIEKCRALAPPEPEQPANP